MEKSNLCPTGKCVEESSKNKNEIRCGQCQKLVTIFSLESQLPKPVEKTKSREHEEKKCQMRQPIETVSTQSLPRRLVSRSFKCSTKRIDLFDKLVLDNTDSSVLPESFDIERDLRLSMSQFELVHDLLLNDELENVCGDFFSTLDVYILVFVICVIILACLLIVAVLFVFWLSMSYKGPFCK